MSSERFQQLGSWIAERELLILLFLAPWLLSPSLSPNITLMALCILPLLWLVRRAAGRPFCLAAPLNPPLLLLLITLAVSFLVAPDAGQSISTATRFLLGAGIYFAFLNWDSRWRRPELVAVILTAVGAGVALYALFTTHWAGDKLVAVGQVIRFVPGLTSVSRFEGIHPNVVGGTMALFIPVVGASVIWAWRWGKRPLLGHWQAFSWAGAIAVLLMLSVLLFTQSRTAILTLLVIGGVAVGVRWRGVGVFIVAVATVVGILVIIGTASGQLTEWMLKVDAIGLDPGIQPYSWLRRLEIWRNAFHIIRDYPLVGCGLDSFTAVAWTNYTFDVVTPTYPLDHAHNLWLQAGTDGGMPGLAAFIWLTFLVILLGLAVHRRRRDERRPLLMGMWLGLLAWLGHGIAFAIPLGTWPAMFVWLLLGVLTSAWQEEEGSVERASSRIRWSGWLVGLIGATLAGVLLWQSPLGALNRGANTLDRALLTHDLEPLTEAQELLTAAGDLSGAGRRLTLIDYEFGDHDRAATGFRADDGAGPYLVSRSRLLISQGELNQTQELTQFGLTVAPESGRLACLAGDAFRLDGDALTALFFYQKVPEREVSMAGHPLMFARCSYHLGLLQKQMGWWSEAAESFRNAVEMDPSRLEYRAEQGWALFQSTGELSQAIAVEEAALEMSPDSHLIMFILTDIYLSAERPQKGLEWALKIVEAAPSDPEGWLRLAQAYWLLEQPSEANQALDQALLLDPENALAADLQEDWSDQ